MGRETDALLAKRAKYRLWGAILLPIGFAGFALAGYAVLQSLVAPLRQRRGPFDEGDNFSVLSVELLRDGDVTPALFALALLSAAFLVAATVFFRRARKITAEHSQTEADVSRQLRVEERLRERKRKGE